MDGKYKLKHITGHGMRLPDGRRAALHHICRNIDSKSKDIYPPEYNNKAYLVVVEYVLPKVKEPLILAVHIQASSEIVAMHRVCIAKPKELTKRTTKHLLYVHENKKWKLIRE